MMLGHRTLRGVAAALTVLSFLSSSCDPSSVSPLLPSAWAWGPPTTAPCFSVPSLVVRRATTFRAAAGKAPTLPEATLENDTTGDSPNDEASPTSSSLSSVSTTTTTRRRDFLFRHGPAVAATSLITACWVPLVSSTLYPQAASARLEAVNRPELLPQGPTPTNVIQTEKVLTTGQAKRMDELLSALERDTGYRVRVLCQRYPVTPGLAIRDYWSVGKEGQKDDKYVVLVVDDFGGKGNVLNFNVGDGVKLALPNAFWTRLQAKYGTTFYVKDNGADLAAINAVEAIATCLRSEEQYCTSVPDANPSLRTLGL